MLLLTKKAKQKWFELGLALNIDIDALEKLDVKYDNEPIKALTRVYRYWLADKNNLQPTWDKLIAALGKTEEYSIAANVAKEKMVSLEIIIMYRCS